MCRVHDIAMTTRDNIYGKGYTNSYLNASTQT